MNLLCFRKVEDQSAAEQTLQNIENNGLSITKCHDQGYDGASDMSRVYSGVQKTVTDTESSVVYIHCVAHSLSSVINDAMKDIAEMALFYDTVQVVYFFGERWDILSCVILEYDSYKKKDHKETKSNMMGWML
jgi:hypothetical protein